MRKAYETIRALKQLPQRGRIGREEGTRELLFSPLPMLPYTCCRISDYGAERRIRPDLSHCAGLAVVGLRDRALIGVMVYTFARVNAVFQMKVRDYFVQGGRGWVWLHEKGGKEHEVPCHHNPEQYLDEYIAAAGIAGDPDAPLSQTAAGKTGTLIDKAMWQQDAYRMIQRRTRGTGIKTRHWHQDEDREPHLPGDRHHCVSEE